jgi:hypothetical protein
MADTSGKRIREARKRRNRELKTERKRLRKEGLLGQDQSGLFAPGERPREVISSSPIPPPAPPAPETQESPRQP